VVIRSASAWWKQSKGKIDPGRNSLLVRDRVCSKQMPPHSTTLSEGQCVQESQPGLRSITSWQICGQA
jgi:hypothetical protein